MMHPEDVHPGCWVMIERTKSDRLINELPLEAQQSPFAEQYLVDRVRALQGFVGVPLWCTAVQFPFLFASSGNEPNVRHRPYVFDFRNVVFAVLQPDVIAGLGLSPTPLTQPPAAGSTQISAPEIKRIETAERQDPHGNDNEAGAVAP